MYGFYDYDDEEKESKEEGWLNEVGAYLSSDAGKFIKLPFLMIYRLINWLLRPKNMAVVIETGLLWAASWWITITFLVPTLSQTPAASGTLPFLFCMVLLIVLVCACIFFPIIKFIDM